jgi:hypothetical protein
MALRDATCMCGNAFGSHGPLDDAYCYLECRGDPPGDCVPSAADVALSRALTPQLAALLYVRPLDQSTCGGGVSPVPLQHRDVCTRPSPTPQPPGILPAPAPVPASNGNFYVSVVVLAVVNCIHRTRWTSLTLASARTLA